MTTTAYKLIWTAYEGQSQPYSSNFKTRDEALKFANSIDGAKTITLYTETREEIKI